MDILMRDLERIRERDESAESTGRRAALFGLAALTVFGLAAALWVQFDADGSAGFELEDPLAALAPSARPLPATSQPEQPEVAEVDQMALTFPEALTVDERPEVAAAVAAAAAELAMAETHHRESASSFDEPTASLPAAFAAGSAPLSRLAAQDAMLRDSLPPPSVDIAQEGQDGEYTIQVISYDREDSAQAFAAGLRARGHHAFVLPAEIEGRGTMYRVRIGPFESLRDARHYRVQFEETERMNTIVIRRR